MVTIKKKGRGLKIMKTRQCESRKEDLAVMEPCHATSRGGSNSEINSEIVENVTQKETAHVEKILEALNARSGLLMRQGTVVAAWREYKGSDWGLTIVWCIARADARSRSIWVRRPGLPSKFAALAKLQTPLRETRRLQLAGNDPVVPPPINPVPNPSSPITASTSKASNTAASFAT